MARLISGVSVVSVRSGGMDVAMTATSVVSVSLEPPTILFCVHSDARLAEAIEDGNNWAISVLSAQDSAVARWLAMPGRPVVGQLDQIAVRRGAQSGAALIDSATSWVECRTEWTRSAGSHEVVVGTVLSAEISTDASGASGGLVHHFGRVTPYREA